MVEGYLDLSPMFHTVRQRVEKEEVSGKVVCLPVVRYGTSMFLHISLAIAINSSLVLSLRMSEVYGLGHSRVTVS